jgi:hypothetical protein
MKLLRMSPGKGDVLLAEGDREVAGDEERLIEEFRRQLELGMWAAVPTDGTAGRREATMVRDFSEVPRGADRVIFFPPAAGGRSMPLPIVIALALAAGVAVLPSLARRRARRSEEQPRFVADPVRYARAERRARELLRATAGEEVYEMYARFGFLRVIPRSVQAAPGAAGEEPAYGYLVYPQRPIVAYDTETGELLSEYCVRFPDESDPEAGRWLPDADDVLAKWMALRADEHRLISAANMHLPGRQLDPGMVRRDLRAANEWASGHA